MRTEQLKVLQEIITELNRRYKEKFNIDKPQYVSLLADINNDIEKNYIRINNLKRMNYGDSR
jgi:hypothetical protein